MNKTDTTDNSILEIATTHNKLIIADFPELILLSDWEKSFDWPTVAGMRFHRFFQDVNNLSDCFVKSGGRIFVRPKLFWQKVENGEIKSVPKKVQNSIRRRVEKPKLEVIKLKKRRKVVKRQPLRLVPLKSISA